MANQNSEVLDAGSFKLVKGIKTAMDSFYLDPIMGLVPGMGDCVSSVFAVPTLYFSVCKVRSLRLTLACLFNITMDMLVGLVPIIGDFFDVFRKSYKKNVKLIEGFVEKDGEAVSQVNKKALGMVGLIVLIAGIIYLLILFCSEWIAKLPDLYENMLSWF